MNVKLKTKVLKSDKLSYYLSYYDPSTRKRSKEYLGLYLFDKPKDELERRHNKEGHLRIHRKGSSIGALEINMMLEMFAKRATTTPCSCLNHR